jgi:hypothetical protein
MRSIIPVNLIIIFAGLILFLSSCGPQSCFEETESFLKASLYNDITKKLQAPDSLSVHGLNKDSTIYMKAVKVQPALFPLNSVTDNCAFVIEINGVADTATFWYYSYPHLISKECGFTFYHMLDSLTFTKNIIDTIIIRNKSITTINEENIRIFY